MFRVYFSMLAQLYSHWLKDFSAAFWLAERKRVGAEISNHKRYIPVCVDNVKSGDAVPLSYLVPKNLLTQLALHYSISNGKVEYNAKVLHCSFNTSAKVLHCSFNTSFPKHPCKETDIESKRLRPDSIWKLKQCSEF